MKQGYLIFDGTKKRFGEIGKKTKMTDYNGKALYVGDVVTVNASKKELENIEDGYIIHSLLKKLGIIQQSPFEPDVALVVEEDDKAFVTGIATEYNDGYQKSIWEVKKIVDHSNVVNNAVIRNVKYVKPMFDVEDYKDENKDEQIK